MAQDDFRDRRVRRTDNGGVGGYRLKPDLQVSVDGYFEIEPEPTDAYRISARVLWQVEEKRYRVAQIEVSHKTEWVTGAGLRRVAVHDLMQHMLRESARSLVWLRTGEPVPDPPTPIPADERDLWAARTYSISRAMGDGGLQAVAELLGVSQSTATRMVSRLRGDGLVD